MAKKKEKDTYELCKYCKGAIIIFAIAFIVLGIWLWKKPNIEGIAQALAVVLILKGLYKLKHFCSCKPCR